MSYSGLLKFVDYDNRHPDLCFVHINQDALFIYKKKPKFAHGLFISNFSMLKSLNICPTGSVHMLNN